MENTPLATAIKRQVECWVTQGGSTDQQYWLLPIGNIIKTPCRNLCFLLGLFYPGLIFAMWLFPVKVIHLKLDWSQANLLCLDLALNKIINGSRNSSPRENTHSGVGKVRWPRCNPGIVEIKWVACRWLQWDQDFSTRLWFLISQRKRQ